MNLLDLSRRRLPAPVLRASKAALWIMLMGVTAASLVPEDYMPDIGAGYIEHFTAYLVFGLAAALGYGWRLGYVALLASAVALAGGFELAQLLLPGRTCSWADFLAGASGALAGASLAHLIRGRNVRTEPTASDPETP